MTNQDEINYRMTEQEERHHREIQELHKEIEELKQQNLIYIRIMDSQPKSIDLFNQIVQSYIERDQIKSMRKMRRE